jgi:hypothetical protein
MNQIKTMLTMACPQRHRPRPRRLPLAQAQRLGDRCKRPAEQIARWRRATMSKITHQASLALGNPDASNPISGKGSAAGVPAGGNSDPPKGVAGEGKAGQTGFGLITPPPGTDPRQVRPGHISPPLETRYLDLPTFEQEIDNLEKATGKLPGYKDLPQLLPADEQGRRYRQEDVRKALIEAERHKAAHRPIKS